MWSRKGVYSIYWERLKTRRLHFKPNRSVEIHGVVHNGSLPRMSAKYVKRAVCFFCKIFFLQVLKENSFATVTRNRISRTYI